MSEVVGSAKIGARPTTSTKMTKEGSVANRIAQLQAKLSPKKAPSPASTLISKAHNSPTANALSIYAASRESLSPRSIPLQQTPARFGQSQDLYNGIHSASAHYSPVTRDSAGLEQLEIVSKPDDDECGAYTEPSDYPIEDNAKSNVEKVQNNEQLIVQPRTDDDDEHAMLQKQASQLSIVAIPIRNRMATPKQSISPRFSPGYSGSGIRSSRIPRLTDDAVPGNRILNSSTTSPDTSNRYANTSTGSAYSKVLPFMFGPSKESYIPRRQSQNSESGEDASPSRLRKMDSTETFNGNQVDSPKFISSPRRRDTRSLRRRTLNAKSESDGPQHTKNHSIEDLSPQSSFFQTALQDVFIEPPFAPKPYHVEPPSMATNTILASSKSLHDIHNPNYVPSVMPRRVTSRQMLSNRHHQRSLSALTGQRQGLLIAAVEQPLQSQIKATNDVSAMPEPCTNSNLDGPGAIASIQGRRISVVSRRSNGFQSLHSGTISAEGQTTLKDNIGSHGIQHRKLSAFLPVDGVGSGYESDESIQSHHRTINVSVMGSSGSSTSRIPRSTPKARSPVDPGESLSQTKQGNWPPQIEHARDEKALKVVITMDQTIEEVVKIEVHPSSWKQTTKGKLNQENFYYHG